MLRIATVTLVLWSFIVPGRIAAQTCGALQESVEELSSLAAQVLAADDPIQAAVRLHDQFEKLASTMPGSQDPLPERYRQLGDLIWSSASAFELIKDFVDASSPRVGLENQLRIGREDMQSATSESRRIGCPV